MIAEKTLHAPRWTEVPELGTPTLLPLVYWIAVRLGRSVARLLLYPIAAYFLCTAHTARRISLQYLRRLGRPVHWWHALHHFYCFAATILDRFYLLRGEFQYFSVDVH